MCLYFRTRHVEYQPPSHPDMRARFRAEIEQKLRDIGINSSVAARGRWVPDRGAKAPEGLSRSTKISSVWQMHLLQLNLTGYEAIVRRGTHAYLTQNEFDALVSLVYNLGRGWLGVRAATNSGDKRKAVKITGERVRSKGKIMNGLVKRRHDEAMLLLEGRY